MYSSQTQRVHVPYKASLPKPPTVPGSAEKIISKEEARNKPPPQNTEATWLKRNVDRLDVADMPTSGSAEYPNYVAARTPSQQEMKVIVSRNATFFNFKTCCFHCCSATACSSLYAVDICAAIQLGMVFIMSSVSSKEKSVAKIETRYSRYYASLSPCSVRVLLLGSAGKLGPQQGEEKGAHKEQRHRRVYQGG